jgi:hypothetical protein
MSSFNFNPNVVIHSPITHAQQKIKINQNKQKNHAAALVGSFLLTESFHLAQKGATPPLYCAAAIIGSGFVVGGLMSDNNKNNNLTKK